MKKTKGFFTWLTLFLVFISPPIFADDVYNFYFQKAPGPVNVIQGGSSKDIPADKKASSADTQVTVNGAEIKKTDAKTLEQELEESGGAKSLDKAASPAGSEGLQTGSAAAKTGSAPAAGTASTPLPTQEGEEKFKKWAIGIGPAYIEDAYQYGWEFYDYSGKSGRRLALSVQRSLNKYIGFDITLGFDSSFGELQQITGRSWGETLIPAAGLTITPIHLNLFGYEMIQVGVAMGAFQTAVRRARNYYSTAEYYFEERDYPSVTQSYFGVQIGIKLTRDLSLEYKSRTAGGFNSTDSGNSFHTASMLFRF